MENGKLGIGESWDQGVILNFEMIPKLQGIKYIACGPNHMLAISDVNLKQDGSTFAWGLNTKGQLGIGNKEDQNKPYKITQAKEKFRKIVCGQNFTLGLSIENKVFFWGNQKYFCEKTTRDFEEPTLLKGLEGKLYKDISCSKY